MFTVNLFFFCKKCHHEKWMSKKKAGYFLLSLLLFCLFFQKTGCRGTLSTFVFVVLLSDYHCYFIIILGVKAVDSECPSLSLPAWFFISFVYLHDNLLLCVKCVCRSNAIFIVWVVVCWLNGKNVLVLFTSAAVKERAMRNWTWFYFGVK